MSVGGFGNGSNSVVTDGLVYYYDGYNTKSHIGSATTVFDLTKNNNTGSFSGPGDTGTTYNDDSFTFDGIGGFYGTPSSPSLNSFTTGLTVNIFTKVNDNPSANGQNYDGIIVKTSSDAWNDGFGFYIDAASGEFRFFVNDYELYEAGEVVGTNPIPLTNYCGVYDGSNVLLYKDGDLLVTGDALTANVINGGLQMNVGCGNTGSGSPRYYSSSTTYIIMIYDRGLNAEEAKQNYNALKYRFR